MMVEWQSPLLSVSTRGTHRATRRAGVAVLHRQPSLFGVVVLVAVVLSLLLLVVCRWLLVVFAAVCCYLLLMSSRLDEMATAVRVHVVVAVQILVLPLCVVLYRRAVLLPASRTV